MFDCGHIRIIGHLYRLHNEFKQSETAESKIMTSSTSNKPLLSKANLKSDIGNIGLKNTFDSYLQYYASGTGNTARAKKVDVEKFLSFLVKIKKYSTADKLTVKDWDQSSVQQFVDHGLKLGEAPSTVSRRLATLKHFGRTFAERIPGFVNPAKDVRPPKAPSEKPKALVSKEVDRVLLRATIRIDDKNSFIRRRNRMILLLLLDTGIRAEEIRALKRSQLDDSLEWIASVRTKGRKYRNVYVTSAIRADLKEYLSDRELELKRFFPKLTDIKNRSLPLFISTYGVKPPQNDTFYMGAKSIWRAINELSAETRLHPHLLRHSFATDLLENSSDIRLVAQALGHTDVRTTMRYTERTSEELARVLEKSRRKS